MPHQPIPREHWNEWSDAPTILGAGGATALGTTALSALAQGLRRRENFRLNWPLGVTSGALASIIAAIIMADKRARKYRTYPPELIPDPYIEDDDSDDFADSPFFIPSSNSVPLR